MKQKLLKILAIFLFAVMIYLSGHLMVWLFGCFALLEWLSFFPFSTDGNGEGLLRMLMFFWATCSGILSYRLTK